MAHQEKKQDRKIEVVGMHSMGHASRGLGDVLSLRPIPFLIAYDLALKVLRLGVIFIGFAGSCL